MAGALVGIGGGIVIVPALVLGFGFDIRVAVATSLVAVVATSTAAGSSYVGRGLANMRLGMTLEVATTIGGIVGGLVAVLVSPSMLSGLFAVIMVMTALAVGLGRGEQGELVAAGIEADVEVDAGPRHRSMRHRRSPRDGRSPARWRAPTTTPVRAGLFPTGRDDWVSVPRPPSSPARCRGCSVWVAGS
ncbi:MAG: sulfite exporter TauE/SafE family protein [Microthrixaceae bacterium]|nr:sulfite exporter TauE/SafE family protein [Microthrixaceae bacterium]